MESLRIRMLHHEMVNDLSNVLNPHIREWRVFCSFLRVYLTPAELARNKDIFTTFDIFMAKGLIRYGCYDALLRIFEAIGLTICVVKVRDYTLKMKTIPRTAEEKPESFDSDDINLYINRIDSKQTVKSRNLRVMLVGQEGVGKTCLCKNLLAKNLDGTVSTDGISIYIQNYVIDMATFKRFEQRDEKEASEQKLKEFLTTTTELYLQEPVLDLKVDGEDKIDKTITIKTDDLHNQQQHSKLDASKSSKTTERPELQYTDGIQKVLNKAETGISSIQERCYASFWDFGGQEDYYNTHHIFLTSDAVYLVVFNLAHFCSSNETLSKKEIERVTYWLQSVVSYSTEQECDTDKVTKKLTPPIVLIGTHLDTVEVEVTDKQIFRDEVEKRLKEDPRTKKIIETHVNGIFTVSNKKKNEEVFEKAWEAILDSAKLQSQWGKPLPAWWLERERVLMSKKQDDVKVQTFKDVKAILKDMKYADNSDEDVFLFLRYMHRTGNIIVCESVEPWSIVIDPQWLADAFKEFITTPKHMNDGAWKRYWDTGKLPLQLIRLAWKRNHNAKYEENKYILLETMKQFGLIVEIPTNDKEQTTGQEDNENTEFVVPCKLPDIGPEPFKHLLERQNVVQSSTLCFEFKSNFIQGSLYDKFVAHCMHKYKPFNWEEGDSSKLIQRRFVCLESSKHPWKMILYCKFNVVKVTLFNFCGDEIQSGIGCDLRKKLYNILQNTLRITHQEHLEFSQELHCNFMAMNDEKLVDPITVLLQTERECDCKEDTHKNLTTSDYDFWFGSSNNKQIDQEDAEAKETLQLKILQPGNLIHPLLSAMELQDRELLSRIETELCRHFKQHIMSMYPYFLYNTWVGYNAKGLEAESEIRNLRIVALYNHQGLPKCSLPKKFLGIPILWREKDSVSEEAIQTSRQENIHINLKTKLSNETVKNLFKKHSNLTIVHPSSVKSKLFGNVNSHVEQKACIALYCHVKGIIPLGEMEFDKNIDGLITDVREGFSRLNADDKLYPGTGITSPTTNIAGTVGAFVEDSSGRTAFVTAAHVVVPSSLWKEHFEERQQYLNSNEIPVCKTTHVGEKIGNVINWSFSEGSENQRSVDAALVEVDKQSISTENMFPQNDNDDWKSAGYNLDELPQIRASKLLKFTEINDKTIFDSSILKYGITSRITLGHFVYFGACIKLHNEKIQYQGRHEPVLMYGLIGVQGSFNHHFGQPGDSGALCCIVDKQDRTQIHPFGMVVAGCTKTGISYVTHLEDVFQMLNLDIDQSIKFYPSNGPPHDSSSSEQTIKKIQNELMEQKKNTEKRFENMESKISHVLKKQAEDSGKLDALLAHFALQTPRTQVKNDIEQRSHEEMEQEESL